MNNTIDLDSLVLARGVHKSPKSGVCVMEAVSMLSGEPWTDHPQCVCPTITEFLINWNDSLNDNDRQMLKQFIPVVVGTNHGPELAMRRSYACADWYARTYLPAWLRLAGLDDEAMGLESCPGVTDAAGLQRLTEPIADAWDAARAAARDAARDAAWDAASDAAWAAAWDVAMDAARAAAWAAARAAARAAAKDALAPTVKTLQASAIDLVYRLIAMKPEAA